ncbi:hypothetical protein RFI_11304 [Reticulomyxa filosa]|uniref:Dynein regulatory complex subunit 7 MORN domain-containing protein n=1 Tax=Reticulomyxa filosa TaxID=46433 RepID=X6NHN5_RETFI|nr:hypothetical protein RFI_11304 [Reticulomyxa filosa]|eukprot:ETO25835.1 hypothetical protein RFI_11304 [Reticulomyxa filosa]
MEKENPYFKIESVFNEKNYWINIDTVNNSPQHFGQMSFNFNDSKFWEFMFFDEAHPLQDFNKIKSNEQNKSSATTDETAPTVFQANKLNKSSSFLHKPEVEKKLLLMPSSWCKPFSIEQSVHDSPYPGRYKKTDYKACVLEQWARFHPKMKGCVLKLTIYKDDKIENGISEMREMFCDRKLSLKKIPFPAFNNKFKKNNERDKLIQRVTKVADKIVMERYAPGCATGVEAMINISNSQRITWFYLTQRIDGLVKRTEVFGEKVIEHSNTMKYLLASKTLLSKEKHFFFLFDLTKKEKTVMSLNFAGDANMEFGVSKVEEFYEKKENEGKEIGRILFSLIDNEYQVFYHYGQNRLLASNRTFNKSTGETSEWQTSSLEPAPKLYELKQQFERLVAREKELITMLIILDCMFVLEKGI